jgi:hypothetical protein
LKNIIYSLAVICFLSSCNHDKKIIVDTYVDSSINNYTQPSVATNEADVEFWKNRIDPSNPGFTNELKYSGTLAAR